ncbi:hypothetical protein Tco_1139682, partial [Tanacetum coccineum]
MGRWERCGIQMVEDGADVCVLDVEKEKHVDVILHSTNR